MRAINLIGPEQTLGTVSSTVNNSIIVRLVTTSTGVVYRTATQGFTGSSAPYGPGTVLGSCTVLPYEPTYLFKDPGDTLTCSGSVFAAPMTYMY